MKKSGVLSVEMRITGKGLSGAVKQAPVGKKAASPGQAQAKPQQDRLEVSKAAVDFLNQQAKRMADGIQKLGEEKDEEEGKSGLSALYDHFQKQMKVMDKCAKISASISKGNRVPPEDLRYLKQHDMNAYRLAMATRKPKKDPKDEESVLSEEDIREMESADSIQAPTSAPAE